MQYGSGHNRDRRRNQSKTYEETIGDNPGDIKGNESTEDQRESRHLPEGSSGYLAYSMIGYAEPVLEIKKGTVPGYVI